MAESGQIMGSSYNRIIQLIDDSDEWKLQQLKTLLSDNYDVYYVHETHRSCPRLQNWDKVKPGHWVLVIFSNKYYQLLMSLVIGVNAGISDDDLDDDIRADTSSINIGWCICGTMTWNIDFKY